MEQCSAASFVSILRVIALPKHHQSTHSHHHHHFKCINILPTLEDQASSCNQKEISESEDVSNNPSRNTPDPLQCGHTEQGSDTYALKKAKM